MKVPSEPKKLLDWVTHSKSQVEERRLGTPKEQQQEVHWDRCELEHRAGTGSLISGGITQRQPVKLCSEGRTSHEESR